MKEVYKLDGNNFIDFSATMVIAEGEEMPDGYLDLDVPDGLYKAKVVNGEVVEGATLEEIAALQPQPQATIEDYLLDIEFRLSMVELGM